MKLFDFCPHAFLLCLPVGILAKDAPNYSPSDNFHPNNVTGLIGLYAWVGSYYNATTEIELTPTTGYTVNETLCPNLQNTTTTTKWNSILSITETGSYNPVTNPVNLWLTLIPPDYEWSPLGWNSGLYLSSAFKWPLISSAPAWTNRSYSRSFFPLISTKPKSSAFNLFGIVHDQSWEATRTVANVSMPACNISTQTGDWEWQIVPGTWWNLEGWKDFQYPRLAVAFDDRTANMTLYGRFSAYPYTRSNASSFRGPQTVSGNGVHGTIRLRFHGVLDTYHSDILDVNASTPTWLRTVGFGNNSLNIGNDQDNAGSSSRVGLGTVSLTSIFVLIGLALSA